jgi:hypothetical protein
MKLLAVVLLSSLALAACGGWQQQMDIALERQSSARSQEIEQADDAECKRQGAQPGTDYYALCRSRVTDKRIAAEAELDRRRMGTVR